MLKVYIDAATNPDLKLSGGGIVISGEGIYQQLTIPLSAATNHEAEFEILLYALDYLVNQQLTQDSIFLYSDSKTVVQTIDKNYSRNARFQDYLRAFQDIETAFSLLLIQWLPEKQNKGADHLARQALQIQQKQSKNRRKKS